MTMAILPPPFVIPLYMGSRPDDDGERVYVADTLSLATVVTLVRVPRGGRGLLGLTAVAAGMASRPAMLPR